jgi:CheY-like chemotaxis protein
MNGIQFLIRVKALSPPTTRILLTGNADINVATQAVNEGNIFRFLSKPCDKETLTKTLNAGVAQYRLLKTEKELLQATLQGSIRVLAEVLSVVDPASFGCAMRVHRYVEYITSKLAMQDSWQLEIAAMMSQLGCVTLDFETIEAVHAGKEILPEQQARFDTHPAVASDWIAKIPRMEPVAWMIAHQNDLSTPLMEEKFGSELANRIQAGAKILGAALAFDSYMQRGVSKEEAVKKIRGQYRELDPQITHYLTEVDADEFMIARTCSVEDLAPGMILRQEVRTSAGMLMVSKGQEVTLQLILKLKDVFEKGDVVGGILVALPRSLQLNVERSAAK